MSLKIKETKSLLEALEDAPDKITDTVFGKICMSVIWAAAVVAVWSNWMPIAGILFGILAGKRIKRLILKRTPVNSQIVGIVGNVVFWWGMLDHSLPMMVVGALLSVKVSSPNNGRSFWSFR